MKVEDLEAARDIIQRVAGLHEKIVADVPALKRGIVWCHKCGRGKKVDSAQCLRKGWPECCGQTMSIDSPEDRAAIAKEET